MLHYAVAFAVHPRRSPLLLSLAALLGLSASRTGLATHGPLAKAGGGSGPRASQMAALPAAAVQHSPGRVLSLDGQRT